MQRIWLVQEVAAVCLLTVMLGCAEKDIPAAQLSIHPVFHTPVTGGIRPAVQVDIRNEDRPGGIIWSSRAKLYLTVQSSRFPSDTWVVLPLNVGDFQGCRSRFVQLPFEAQAGDNLIFNLLDDQQLTPKQERRLLDKCRVGGFCIAAGTTLYAPSLASLVVPTSQKASELLGEEILDEHAWQKHRNLGAAKHIVQQDAGSSAHFPRQPNQANELTLLDETDKARVILKLYGPPDALPSPIPESTVSGTKVSFR